MSLAVGAVRRRPLGLVPLLAALAVGLFVLAPASRSQAAPPPNDTCGTNGANAIPLTFGTFANGDTSQATNNYSAVVTPTSPSSPASAVPAAGPDVVYKIDLTTNQWSQVTVKAGFQASVYATLDTHGGSLSLGSSADCGRALAVSTPNSQISIASNGGPILLLPPTNPGDPVITWYIVVDGWGSADKGAFEIGVSLAPLIDSGGTTINLDNSQAVIGSVVRSLSTRNSQWDFSESSTRDGFREFITLSSDTTQDVTISYFIDPGSPGAAGLANPTLKTVHLPAGQRVTVIANDPPTGGVGQNLDFAFRVNGSAPFQASAVLYSVRDVGLGQPAVGVTGIQGQHN